MAPKDENAQVSEHMAEKIADDLHGINSRVGMLEVSNAGLLRDMHHINEHMSRLAASQEKMTEALVTMARDQEQVRHLVRQGTEIKARQDGQSKRIDAVSRKADQNGFRVNLMWGGLGIAYAGLVAAIAKGFI